MLQFSLTKKILIWVVVVLGFLFAMPNGFYNRVESVNDARMQLENGNDTPEIISQASNWPSFLPSALVNLGLDLRGGAHLLARVRVDQVYEARMDAYWPEVRNALRKERASIGTIRRIDGENYDLRVRISEPSQINHAVEVVSALARPVTTLSGAGSRDIVVTSIEDTIIIELSEAEKIATDTRTMDQSLEIIRRRVDEAGTREPTIQRQGTDRVLIQVPGIGSAEELKSIIGKTAKLTFHKVIQRTSNSDERVKNRQILLPAQDEEGVFYVLEKTPVINGDHLTDAQPAFDQNNRPAVSFRLNTTGARIFGQYTAENIGTPFAIVLDQEVVSAPTIQSHISGGSGIITGQFGVEETTLLSIQLRAGALPAELEYLQESTVGPDLGQDSIDAGTLACIVAFIAVLVFMSLSYGLFGIFANVALIINVALIFAVLSVISGTLTLPGIAGIVLTVGMAVDANVLVFERIREELKKAKNPRKAIELGYERAFSAIIDANITTLIAAVILLVFGSGPVKGFAITLGIGIVTSVFTAIWVTRLLISIWIERKRPKSIEI
ncbi:protein translocase subunit SecD [Amylibacter sp.]|jgi:preprotein translocase subunit SecD|nr:protein-export membrane protein SecD [alpha proteobacterium HTCC2255] [Rhodobacterales bacterium HTCC2255]MBT4323112.1 protein translocase subunit SecD [Rhodobacterales bacterium]MCO4795985.1 protein translocase subunit SecD [Amylibacter sp.]MDB2393785.1 protein translocase subunit SecD [bacterium]MBT7558957.1 protein translocase subunit SecD [Rhodobacterales bacterium]|tara:strand:- start:372 stop:2033 length:1662 start_codon:yes stop_codon:yes gene_type:complete